MEVLGNLIGYVGMYRMMMCLTTNIGIDVSVETNPYLGLLFVCSFHLVHNIICCLCTYLVHSVSEMKRHFFGVRES